MLRIHLKNAIDKFINGRITVDIITLKNIKSAQKIKWMSTGEILNEDNEIRDLRLLTFRVNIKYANHCRYICSFA